MDFVFRAQKNGSEVHFSPEHICIATWHPGHAADHGPIHDAQIGHDTAIFNTMYSVDYMYKNRLKLEYDNWKKSPKIWRRRFSKGIPKTYEELCEQEGYVNVYA
jgi:hypothetical protein